MRCRFFLLTCVLRLEVREFLLERSPLCFSAEPRHHQAVSTAASSYASASQSHPAPEVEVDVQAALVHLGLHVFQQIFTLLKHAFKQLILIHVAV